MGEVPVWDIESRVQGAGGVQGELVMLRVYYQIEVRFISHATRVGVSGSEHAQPCFTKAI